MKHKYFAFGSEGKVSFIVKNEGTSKDGKIRGGVLNGQWDGLFTETEVFVPGMKEGVPGEILWSGDSFPVRGYNEQIAWVQAQIAGKSCPTDDNTPT